MPNQALGIKLLCCDRTHTRVTRTNVVWSKQKPLKGANLATYPLTSLFSFFFSLFATGPSWLAWLPSSISIHHTQNGRRFQTLSAAPLSHVYLKALVIRRQPEEEPDDHCHRFYLLISDCSASVALIRVSPEPQKYPFLEESMSM